MSEMCAIVFLLQLKWFPGPGLSAIKAWVSNYILDI